MKQIHASRPEPGMAQTGGEADRFARPIGGSNQPTPPEDMFSADFFNLDDNFWSMAGDFDLGEW